MLFSSQRLMEEHVVESMPNTTNAEEAMHWRFYSATGRDHSFMHGMNSLYKIAMDFECQFDAVNSACSPSLFLRKTNYFSEGIPIRYRRPEAWKVIAAEIGRTKPTCAEKPNEKKRKKNDGRPPDTIKELLNKSTNQTLRGVPRETEKLRKLQPQSPQRNCQKASSRNLQRIPRKILQKRLQVVALLDRRVTLGRIIPVGLTLRWSFSTLCSCAIMRNS
jgi:hypothetical protein